MNYKISKELFEAVIDFEVDYCIGIDTFFFKCKEWALEQGYEIFTSGIKCSVYKISKGWIIDQLESTSEQQAAFDACQWILNNKDRQ